MNLPQIQTELFRQLVGIETLLKNGHPLLIAKMSNGEIFCAMSTPTEDHEMIWDIDVRTITTPDQITAEINRIWNEIPDECKREDILK